MKNVVKVMFMDFARNPSGNPVLDKTGQLIPMARAETAFVKNDERMIGNLFRRYPNMFRMSVIKGV